jgi:hypothetical protein
MNGGKVYNILKLKLNNDVIKIIQRYTLPIKPVFRKVKCFVFINCKICNIKKLVLKPFFVKHIDEYEYICLQCRVNNRGLFDE